MADEPQQGGQYENALLDESIPHFYFNGFINGLGTGDISIVLQRSGGNVAVLNTSYTVAKTLALKLGELVAALEEATGNSIMTVEDIGSSLAKQQEEGKTSEHSK